MNERIIRYNLPEELIAQFPVENRDESRLMVVDRLSGKIINEHLFKDIGGYINMGDLLVFNDSRVLPARLFGHKSTGGKVELLLSRLINPETARWEVLLKSSSGRIKNGMEVVFEGNYSCKVVDRGSDNTFIVEFGSLKELDLLLEASGKMPLPPYIKRDTLDLDRIRYQTVYAKEPGAVAAPTAGLHFTPQLMNSLAGSGVNIDFVTLFVGLGTFAPLKDKNFETMTLHTEAGFIPKSTVSSIKNAKDNGKRLIAVGTIAARTLESRSLNGHIPVAGEFETDIFITPGYNFKACDALITNFHLPGSSLLLMVDAFLGGRGAIREIYEYAVKHKYRFFSYGDAMLIV